MGHSISLFSFSQNGSHNAGITATVEDGQDNKRYFIRC